MNNRHNIYVGFLFMPIESDPSEMTWKEKKKHYKARSIHDILMRLCKTAEDALDSVEKT
jgi:hypothetical protein